MSDKNAIDSLLATLPGALAESGPDDSGDHVDAPAPPRLPQLMRKIPVTLTLEVGSAKLTLQELAAIGHDSVVELDTIAGEPLTMRVNGTAIGRAEVVVSGDKYGLKVLELRDLELGGPLES